MAVRSSPCVHCCACCWVQVSVDGRSLTVDLAALNLKLECPYAIRVSWSSAAAAAAAATAVL